MQSVADVVYHGIIYSFSVFTAVTSGMIHCTVDTCASLTRRHCVVEVFNVQLANRLLYLTDWLLVVLESSSEGISLALVVILWLMTC